LRNSLKGIARQFASLTSWARWFLEHVYFTR